MCRHDIVVLVLPQAPHQTKVSNFHHLSGGQKNIPGRQVSVDEAPAFQILHASYNLDAEEPEAGEWVLTLARAQHIIQGAHRG